MELAMIGFGRMGSGLTARLTRAGHRVVVVDPHVTVEKVAASGGEGPAAIGDLPRLLAPPRIAWVMVPPGEITEAVVRDLFGVLEADDIVIDGGNSNYRDSTRRADEAARTGLRFLDVGVSGGVWGLTEGFGLMVGGSQDAFACVEPILQTLAPKDGGLVYAGPSGAGHFTKMVHNGIEYGLMQAYAEGFEILKASEYRLDLAEIAEAWRYGTVIRSWLLDLAARALSREPDLASVRDYVEDSGEGRWTVAQAIDTDVPAPIITLALLERLRSRQEVSFTGQMVAALRREFGGHSVRAHTDGPSV